MDAAVLASTPPAAAGEEPRDAPMVRGILRSVGLRGSASTTPVWWTDSWSSPAATRAMCSARPGRTPTTPAGRRSRPTTCTSRSGPSPRSPPGRRAVSRNTIPLHKAAAPPGWIPLPSLEDTMLSPNYLVDRPAMPSLDQVEETEDDDEGSDPNSNTEQEHNDSTSNKQTQINAMAVAAVRQRR
ncbi:hypothetical protein PVAP13_2KG557600 [Panicum virgatum]|uniref:Uncharacterized protein n=1 Tax=Panicum virgatum TaxID=38727 RepID=A0A8T0WFR4_PANVG|nr:hypothetical protein PVAP13_2KG557600 [Panicum virgatum]